MRSKNVLVILIILVIVAALAIVALVLPNQPKTLPDGVDAAARGYVYITAGGESRWFELPEAETPLTLRRTQDDGTAIENTIHITPEGAYMAHSTCENQDCVQQGTVTLDNRATRPLQNMILCLPNNVTIALYSAEELAEMTAAE